MTLINRRARRPDFTPRARDAWIEELTLASSRRSIERALARAISHFVIATFQSTDTHESLPVDPR